MKNSFIPSKILLIGLIIILLILGGFLFWKINRSAVTANSLPSVSSNENNSSTNIANDINKIAIDKVPILMYHYIRSVTDPNDTLGANLSVSPEVFSSQLDYLVSDNYQTISLRQMRDGFSGSYKIDATKKPIVITFDDGYDDAYSQAFPALKKHNMIGVFYIISGQIGQSERMTNDQIVALDKAGMIIGSHTVSHLDISALNATQLKTQLLDSKNMLEQLLGHPIFDFCYPAGKYNQNDIDELKSLGYASATTTKSGTADSKSDLFQLPRLRIQNNTDLEKVLK